MISLPELYGTASKRFACILLFAMLGVPQIASAAPVSKAVFQNGATSTGWIDFDSQDGKRIFIPAMIDGRRTVVLLANGLPTPDIDRAFAASLGLRTRSAESVGNVQIQIGNLLLPRTAATLVDFSALAKHLAHPLPLLLGDDAFRDMVVDIDFPHHRIAFRTADSLAVPPHATKISMTRDQGEYLVPVSVEGRHPALFELGLGNSGEMLVYQSYYKAHNLLGGRMTSRRLAAGSGGFIPETVATFRRLEFAGMTFTDVPAAFIPSSQTGTSSELISGDLGLPVLARFRLIIDYAHDVLYTVPYRDARSAAFAKDRLGLFLDKAGTEFAVRFVAPHSPAAAAGFKVGDKVKLIDDRAAPAWPEPSFADLRYGARGSTITFTMEDGSTRKVKFADYF